MLNTVHFSELVWRIALASLAALAFPPRVSAQDPFVLVLGIAQDAGYPQAGCRKACCLPVWAGERPGAHVACLALVDPATGQAWMFDATPDFREQLHSLQQYGQLSGIFLTHAHIGHYTGLMHLGREAMGARLEPVFAMPRMKTFLETNGPWSQLVSLENVSLRPLTADSAIVLNERLRVTPFQVPHRDEYSETVGFRIEGPSSSLLFIPDIDKWQQWGRDIRQLIGQVDYALLDGTFFANGEIPGRDMSEIPHPFIEESLALFSGLPETERAKVHFIHFNHTNPVLDRQSTTRERVEEAGCELAEEGMRFGL